MDDLVQFLRDRLAEDAKTALSAALGRSKYAAWRAEETDVYTQEVILSGHAHRVADTGPTYPGADDYEEDAARAAHIARHDPARVLREVEAKRRILDSYLPDAVSADEQINEEWHTGSALADDLLCLLALPYSDHPDYRDDWRP
ncbi:DUF6221 family protein [Streptomyces anulatus]|uniref:DUF6221 family protein n=1 Tax=Streptomyces anulatus TaxID=1892 RepID=UPI003431C0C2